ncbi:MAG: ABC transporter substrate-binding protein [Geminicoccaceae bacterium]|nr:ABC transporter substrate-binding protein [Geminicoccaceae bacterium]
MKLDRRAFLASALVPLLSPGASLGAATPRRGGVLVVAADTEPRNLNPALVASNGVFFVASKVVEPLAEMAYTDAGLEPRLALSWEGSRDGRSVTFRLRPGVRFHDGTPFTSADVAYCALELWKKHQNLGRAFFKDLEAVDTPDPHTAVLRFSEPTPAQLVANALPPLTAVVPRRLFEGTDPLANPHNQKLVGTGPFRFVEHKPGQYYRLERNPDYWGAPLPWLDGIVYRVLPDRGAIAAALESGEIHLAAFSAVPLADMKRLASVPGIAVIAEGYEGITYQITVEINHRRKELADVRVRRAIAHAIDRDFVVRTIFLGWAKPATGPVPRFDKAFYTDDVPSYPFDPARAEALLDAAGYPRKADGVRFAVELMPAPWFEQTRQMGEYLRQALRAIGIEARLVLKDPAGHQKAVYTDHAFDLAIGSPVYRNDPAISTTILYESGLPAGVPFSNQYGYANPEMDRVIRAAARALDPEERAALYRRFQRLAMEDLPIVPVCEFTFLTVARTSVRNVASNPRWAVSNWADCWLEA